MNLVNPFELGPTGLLAWGLVAHVLAGSLQNEWMVRHKTERGGWSRPPRPSQDDSPTELLATRMEAAQQAARGPRRPPWWVRHPAAYIHAAIQLLALALVFGLASLPLAVAHLLIEAIIPSGAEHDRERAAHPLHLAAIAAAAIAVTVL